MKGARVFLQGGRFLFLASFIALLIACGGGGGDGDGGRGGDGGSSDDASSAKAANGQISISLGEAAARAVSGISEASVLPDDITRATARCTGSGMDPVSGSVPLDGTPLVLTVPSGPDRVVTVNAYAGSIVRMSGSAPISYLHPGTTTTVTITLVDLATITLSPEVIDSDITGPQQFSAEVTHHADTSVSWSVNGIAGGNGSVGTISTSGLYTPPPALSSPMTVTIRATSNEDPTLYAEITATVVPVVVPVTVTVTPSTVIVPPGQQRQFSASVQGTANQSVTWYVNDILGGNATVGTIDSDGLYTAPASAPTPPTVTVKGTSVVDPNASGAASVTIAVAGFVEATYWGNEYGQAGRGISIFNSSLYIGGIGYPPSPATYEAIALQFDIPPGDSSPVWFATWGTYEIFFDVVTSDTGVYGAGLSYNFSQDFAGTKEYKSALANYVPPGTAPQWYNCPNIYPYSGYESLKAVIMADGFVFAAGYAQENFYNRQAALYKYSKDGTHLDTYFFTGTGSYISQGEGLVSSNGYIYASGFDAEGSDKMVLAQFDEDGNLNPIWLNNRTYQPAGRIARGYGVTGDGSGNLYQVGYSDVSNSVTGDEDILFLKYDEDGNLLWAKQWGGPEADYGWAVACTGPRVFVVGQTGSFGSGSQDVVLLEVDPADGTVLSEIFWGGPGGEAGYDAALTDTDLYVVGQTSSVGAGSSDVLVLRYDLTGTVLPVSVAVTVDPATVTLSPSDTQLFTAVVQNTANQKVAWYVDNIRGGNATVGTIDSDGLYTAPASVPSPPSVTVMAVSFVDPSTNGAATISLN